MADKQLDDTLRDQLTYYRNRAAEYEQFYTREGRYNRGDELNRRFLSELGDLRKFLQEAKPSGDILELAAGTGYWTQHLATQADRLTVVDGAPEMLAIARGRLPSAKIEWLEDDLFKWKPARRYDTVFFAFWLSHVPWERFEEFWKTVGSAIKPNGRVLFMDSRFDPTSTAKDHVLKDPSAARVVRKLNDGQTFEIVKIFHDPEDLTARLKRLGWNVSIQATPNYFLFGSGSYVG